MIVEAPPNTPRDSFIDDFIILIILNPLNKKNKYFTWVSWGEIPDTGSTCNDKLVHGL